MKSCVCEFGIGTQRHNKLREMCGTRLENTGGGKRWIGHDPLVHWTYWYWPDRAHSCPGQGAWRRQAAGEHGLSLQFSWTDPRKCTFAARTVDKWNKLPGVVKSSLNSEIFKNTVKNYREGNYIERWPSKSIMDNKEIHKNHDRK